jgi:hypothetical protein
MLRRFALLYCIPSCCCIARLLDQWLHVAASRGCSRQRPLDNTIKAIFRCILIFVGTMDLHKLDFSRLAIGVVVSILNLGVSAPPFLSNGGEVAMDVHKLDFHVC